MRRTRFKNNVVKLAAHKPSHDGGSSIGSIAKRDGEYRIGLMVWVRQYDLTPADKALCDLLASYSSETKVPRSAFSALNELLGRLVYVQPADPRGLMVHIQSERQGSGPRSDLEQSA